jgi:hypothetical protein
VFAVSIIWAIALMMEAASTSTRLHGATTQKIAIFVHLISHFADTNFDLCITSLRFVALPTILH